MRLLADKSKIRGTSNYTRRLDSSSVNKRPYWLFLFSTIPRTRIAKTQRLS